jgi:hypothetical protein
MVLEFTNPTFGTCACTGARQALTTHSAPHNTTMQRIFQEMFTIKTTTKNGK